MMQISNISLILVFLFSGFFLEVRSQAYNFKIKKDEFQQIEDSISSIIKNSPLSLNFDLDTIFTLANVNQIILIKKNGCSITKSLKIWLIRFDKKYLEYIYLDNSTSKSKIPKLCKFENLDEMKEDFLFYGDKLDSSFFKQNNLYQVTCDLIFFSWKKKGIPFYGLYSLGSLMLSDKDSNFPHTDMGMMIGFIQFL